MSAMGVDGVGVEVCSGDAYSPCAQLSLRNWNLLWDEDDLDTLWTSQALRSGHSGKEGITLNVPKF